MNTPILTTMTVLYATGVRLNTDRIIHHLPINEKCIKIEKQGVLKRGSSLRDSIRKRPKVVPKRTTGFGHNSLTLVVFSDGDGSLRKKEITVKIFQNGVFHITGVLDEKYDMDVVEYLTSHISEYCPEAMLDDEWDLTKRRVVLMNYKTKITNTEVVSRDTLYSNLRRNHINVNYEPDVYPAVKIYFNGEKWIAKVFRTGNIILTGMTSKEELAFFTGQLENILLNNLRLSR